MTHSVFFVSSVWFNRPISRLNIIINQSRFSRDDICRLYTYLRSVSSVLLISSIDALLVYRGMLHNHQRRYCLLPQLNECSLCYLRKKPEDSSRSSHFLANKYRRIHGLRSLVFQGIVGHPLYRILHTRCHWRMCHRPPSCS